MSVPVALAEPPAGHLMLQTAPRRRGSVLLLATTLAATFLRPPWPSRGIPSYTPRGALGFGAEDKNVTVDEAVDQIVKGLLKNAEKFVDYVEDETLQRAMVKHLSEKGNLTTLNLIHEAKITLVGVNHLSREAAKFAERQVRKNKPSALVLELCEERVGMLILGNCYREASRKNLMKPDEPDAMRRARVGNADEARRSFRGLMARTNATGSGQLLVLADLKESFIGSKVTYDDVTKPEIRAIRDHNLAVQIFQTVLLDHHCIVAILGANHLDGVEKELRAFNESFATLGGSFSEAASTLGTEMWLRQPMPTGLYISASGCKKLQALQKKLQEKVPLEKWRKRKSLAKKSRVAIESKLFTFSNSKKICSALLHDDCNAKKPSSWRDLKEWWDRVLKGRNKRTT